MVETTAPGLSAPRINVLPARRLFTADEYHRMVDAGIFCENERLELIDGEIILMAPIKEPHVGCVIFLEAWSHEHLSGRATVKHSQAPKTCF
ncbi:MAG: hypothetical protein ACR2PL_22695 [Dehalococcoidia bacterium]